MNRKFIYFINPISGTGGKVLLQEIIKKKTTEKNILNHPKWKGVNSWEK